MTASERIGLFRKGYAEHLGNSLTKLGKSADRRHEDANRASGAMVSKSDQSKNQESWLAGGLSMQVVQAKEVLRALSESDFSDFLVQINSGDGGKEWLYVLNVPNGGGHSFEVEGLGEVLSVSTDSVFAEAMGVAIEKGQDTFCLRGDKVKILKVITSHMP